MKYSPFTITQFFLSLHGQGMNWPIKLRANMAINPKKPSKNTNFRGLNSYLLKIHFYETKPPPLNMREAKSKITPKIWLSCVDDEALNTVII